MPVTLPGWRTSLPMIASRRFRALGDFNAIADAHIAAFDPIMQVEHNPREWARVLITPPRGGPLTSGRTPL